MHLTWLSEAHTLYREKLLMKHCPTLGGTGALPHELNFIGTPGILFNSVHFAT